MSHTNDIDNLIHKKLHEAVTWNFKTLHHPHFLDYAARKWGSSVNLAFRKVVSAAKKEMKSGEERFVIFKEHDYSNTAKARIGQSWDRDKGEWRWNEQIRFKEKTSIQDFLFFKFQAVTASELNSLGFKPKISEKTISTTPQINYERSASLGDAELITRVVAYIKETSNV